MKDDNAALKIKRGYLHGDFDYFHLKDKKSIDFESHYHDFNKIIIFLSGNVTYLIEGKAYKLKPWDILFISSNDIHRPIINPDETYERIIIWVNSKFLNMHNRDDSNLLTCFELSSLNNINLFRLNPENISTIKHTLFMLEDATKDRAFGNKILKNSLFIQLMVYLNRLFLGSDTNIMKKDMDYDERIVSIINYINQNLSNDLSIETIATTFYTNKYYLMHKFKAQTGYTIHSYIHQKRLILAKSLIKEGYKITQVAINCGFGDYSNFARAFTKAFGLSPKKYYKAVIELENSYNGNIHI